MISHVTGSVARVISHVTGSATVTHVIGHVISHVTGSVTCVIGYVTVV